jgi:aminopeptidase N
VACLCHRNETLGMATSDATRMPFAEPGVEPHYAPSRSVRITHVDMRLEIDPVAHTFVGRSRFRMEAVPGYAGHFAFDLDEVSVESVEDGEGNALSWRHGDGELRIRIDSVPAEVCVRWTGADPQHGLYFTGPTPHEPNRQHMAWTQCQDEDGHFLMPCHDHPGVKHSWRVELVGPAGYTLLSNGRHVETRHEDDRTVSVYEQAEPMPAYLFTAVCAELSVVEAEWRGRSVRYLVPVGEEAAVMRTMGKTPLMMDEFSRITGIEYPWPRYDTVVVHDFIFGGMENVACTTMTDVLLVDEKGILDWDPDGLVAHELAHQWFGDLVTCQDWSQGWLNESWATFMEAVWWEADRSEVDAIWYRYETSSDYFDEAGGRYRRPIVSYRFREPIDVFDRHLYNKGSCVLWTLRAELGDAAFWSGVKLYLTRHRDQTVHTRHFQRALEDASGRNLDGFFEQWVHSPGHPVLDVTLGREEGLVTVAVKQKQTGDDGVPDVFHFTLRVMLIGEEGEERVIDLPVRERERVWAVPTDMDVASVRVDPGYRLLGQVSLKGPANWMIAGLLDACPVVAVRSAKGLLASDSSSGLAAVVEALSKSSFHGVRSALASLLAKRGGAAIRDALAEALKSEPDPRVQRALVTALGRFRDPVAADAILTILDGDLPTWQLHGAALTALGNTRDPRAKDAILAHLDVDCWSYWVPQRALLGLANTRDAAVATTLLQRTSPEWPDRVRGAAATALGRLADKVESVRNVAVERLVEMLNEPGFRSMMLAIGALGRLRDPRSAAALERVHSTAPDGRMRRTAYEALVKVRRGRESKAGLEPVHRRIEELEAQNNKLRARLDRLEPLES